MPVLQSVSHVAFAEAFTADDMHDHGQNAVGIEGRITMWWCCFAGFGHVFSFEIPVIRPLNDRRLQWIFPLQASRQKMAGWTNRPAGHHRGWDPSIRLWDRFQVLKDVWSGDGRFAWRTHCALCVSPLAIRDEAALSIHSSVYYSILGVNVEIFCQRL